MGSQFRRLVEQAQLYRTKANDVIKNKKKKSKLKNRYIRFKSDHFTHRQHGLYLELNKLFFGFNIQKDFKKTKQWWDLVIQKNKIAIKIMYPNSKPVNTQALEKLGWRVLYVNFFDDAGISYTKLVGDIKFILTKPVFIQECAIELNKDLPKSEVWFLEKIKKEWFWKKMRFEQNVPLFGNYIYDMFSSKYRLCIEVDGSIHALPEQQTKDNLKNQVTISKGFHIIRVEAFNEKSYAACVLLIEQVIKNFKARKYKIEKQQEINNKIVELEKMGKLGF